MIICGTTTLPQFKVTQSWPTVMKQDHIELLNHSETIYLSDIYGW